MPGDTLVGMAELTDLEMRTLDFEESWANRPKAGPKEAAIREVFGESSVAYYARLDRLRDNTYAWVYKPQLIKRLRDLRTARQRNRSASKLAG